MTPSVLERLQFVYVVGSSRSGTTWLQVLLRSHPSVCTTVELTLFDRYLAPIRSAWDTERKAITDGKWIQGLPHIWTEGEFLEWQRSFLARAYEAVVPSARTVTHIVDKHPGYAAYVNVIAELVPNSRFIHLIRDGRDVAASKMAARANMGFGPSTVEAAAREWRCHIEDARRAREYAGRYLEVRYEELLRNTPRSLGEVFAFCGLEMDRGGIADIAAEHSFAKMQERQEMGDPTAHISKAHYRRGRAGDWKRDLTPGDRFIFDSCAGQLLCQLGYAEKGWWAESAIERVTLPLWHHVVYRVVVPVIRFVTRFVREAIEGLRRGPGSSV